MNYRGDEGIGILEENPKVDHYHPICIRAKRDYRSADTNGIFLKLFKIFGVKEPPLKLVVKNGRIVFYEAGPSDGQSVLRAYNFYSGR